MVVSQLASRAMILEQRQACLNEDWLLGRATPIRFNATRSPVKAFHNHVSQVHSATTWLMHKVHNQLGVHDSS